MHKICIKALKGNWTRVIREIFIIFYFKNNMDLQRETLAYLEINIRIRLTCWQMSSNDSLSGKHPVFITVCNSQKKLGKVSIFFCYLEVIHSIPSFCISIKNKGASISWKIRLAKLRKLTKASTSVRARKGTLRLADLRKPNAASNFNNRYKRGTSSMISSFDK